jgi:hypothetical protein
LRFDFTGHTILEVSILENWVQLEATKLLLLTLHVDLELGLTSRHSITFNGIRLLGVPTTTTSLLADCGGMSKGISGQLAETIVRSGDLGGW